MGLPNDADPDHLLNKIIQLKEQSRWKEEIAALRQTIEKSIKLRTDKHPKKPHRYVINEMAADYMVAPDNDSATLSYLESRPVPAIEYEAAAGGAAC